MTKHKVDKKDWIPECNNPYYEDTTIRPCHKCGIDTRFCKKCVIDHHIVAKT